MTKGQFGRFMGAALILAIAIGTTFTQLSAQRAEAKPAEKAAAPAAPSANGPALTTEQKQGIQILAQRIELAQLRAQAAQTEFERARGEIAQLLQSLKVDGYDLDLQTMAYVKTPAPPKTPEKKDPPK